VHRIWILIRPDTNILGSGKIRIRPDPKIWDPVHPYTNSDDEVGRVVMASYVANSASESWPSNSVCLTLGKTNFASYDEESTDSHVRGVFTVMLYCVVRRQHVGSRVDRHLRPGGSLPGSGFGRRDVIAVTCQLQRTAHVPGGGVVLYVTRPRANDGRVLEQFDVRASRRRASGHVSRQCAWSVYTQRLPVWPRMYILYILLDTAMATDV